jgi:hypothetical protein
VVKAAVESQRGKFNGTGTASGQRDAKLADSLVELAETRAIARALRFSGIGVEFTSFEEVAHVGSAAESEQEQSVGNAPAQVFPGDNSHNKSEKSKPSSDGIGPATTGETRAPSGATVGTKSKPHGATLEDGVLPVPVNHLSLQVEGLIFLMRQTQPPADHGKRPCLPLVVYFHLAMDQLAFQKLTISVCAHCVSLLSWFSV